MSIQPFSVLEQDKSILVRSIIHRSDATEVVGVKIFPIWFHPQRGSISIYFSLFVYLYWAFKMILQKPIVDRLSEAYGTPEKVIIIWDVVFALLFEESKSLWFAVYSSILYGSRLSFRFGNGVCSVCQWLIQSIISIPSSCLLHPPDASCSLSCFCYFCVGLCCFMILPIALIFFPFSVTKCWHRHHEEKK